ncbi:stage V sporulation protein B [Caloramator quimbayensis]|uniref:Stage V sporulation protein B n=1 Tax=Caloramator quimbayensis TaxID=1147123 RepID=A0A1T4XMC2_9CLOT|nr:stage V sporulation protein B [Caloramator quimbayensis]SKA90699.1 stage V sporulation protein B [Caloramator quimbayensis]
MKRSSFAGKTLILILSNIITGTLAFVFSIILSRKIGSEGMGLYQLTMPVYSLFLCITGGGITVSISKIAAEKKATGNLKELYNTIKAVCIFEIIWSILVTAVLIMSCSIISKKLLYDERTMYGIIAFCPALIIISISSVYKGAYYGIQRVLEPAIIDIVEKIIRIIVICTLLSALKSMSLEIKTAAAFITLSFGEMVSLILFVICFKGYVRKNPIHGKSDNDFQLIFNVLRLSFPLALNGILGTIFTAIIAVLIPRRLQDAGFIYEEALSLFGKLEGMALTIAFYPSIVINSLCVLLVPSISEAVTFKKEQSVTRKMNLSLKITSLIAFSSAAIFFSIPLRIGFFFYNDETVGELLKMLSIGLPLVYIEITLCALLNGIGKQGALLLNSIIIALFELIALYIFIGIPDINIKGYAIDFILYPIIGIILNLKEIKKSLNYSFDFTGIIIFPFLCSILLYFIINSVFINISSTPLLILISYLTYGIIYYPINKMQNHSNL